MKYILILYLVLSANSFAVTPVTEGQKSPETGYIFDHQEEKQIRQINETKLKLIDLAIAQDKMSQSQSERISVLEQEVEKRSFTTTQKVLYFTLGILATSFSIVLASKLRN